MNRIDTILRHIQEDCQDIQAFTDGLDERSFLENKLVRNAVGMSLIVSKEREETESELSKHSRSDALQ